MRLLPRSLLWRTLVVVLSALVLSQAAALWLLNEHVTKPRMATGAGHFVSHLKTINAALQTMTATQQQQFIDNLSEREGIRISPVAGDEHLRPAGDWPPMRPFRERLREIFGPNTDVYVRAGDPRREAGADGRPRLLLVKLIAGERAFWVAFPRGRIDRDTTGAFIAWAIAGLGIAILATFFLVWRLNRPLGELARAAGRIGRGGDPPPVAETGPTEIRAVARAFNQMKDDLRSAERERATFLAGISHDLRTPLSRLRLDVEMLEDKVDPAVQRGMIDDLGDMNAIIDQFIDFARSEASEPASVVDLSELARACADRAGRSGAQVRCELAEVPLLTLRPLAMQRLVDNLIGNAARHAGGEIVLRTSAGGNKVTLAVLDRGPGIPPELVGQVRQPFRRRDDSRSGSSGAGLGLAIVDRVAALHGGIVELLPREGGGLEARVTLESSARD